MPEPNDRAFSAALAENVFSFSSAFGRAQDEGCGPDESLGRALAADYGSRAPSVRPDDIVVGGKGTRSLVTLNHTGLLCARSVPDEMLGTPLEREASAVIRRWTPLVTSALFTEAKRGELTGAELDALAEPSFGWAGGWGGHCVLGYESILFGGIEGIRRKVESSIRRAETVRDTPTLDWLSAELAVCGGMAEFILSHAEAAETLAEIASAEGRNDDAVSFGEIAAVCRPIAKRGARTFREAVQLFWFVHVLDETDSPGRIDQFLYPYYLSIDPDPEVRRRAAEPVIEALWRKFIENRTWNVCLGGQTAEGGDATNELSWLFLEMQERFGREAPNLSVRIHRNSPRELLDRCVEVISRGSGQPALYNDEVIIPALVGLGIPVRHARNYAMNGCAQIDIQGMSHMGLEDGEISLAKCLELALHGGISPVTGRMIGAGTLTADEIEDFPALIDQLHRQIDFAVDLFTRVSNIFQRVQAESCPQLLRSLFVEDCVGGGRDLKRSGPLYNHGQFQTEGIANCGDSLYTIRRLVFDEGRMTLAELVAILDADWAGREALRLEVMNRFPKYGNGTAEVDDLTAAVLDRYFTSLGRRRTYRGGTYSGGVVVFNRAIGYGKGLAAGADGRLKGEPVADSVGPSQGRDRSGPTAMLASVSKLPFRKATCAVCLNLKLLPSIFKGERARGAVARMFDTYFSLGGQQLQVNVVDSETLRAAQEDPDRHRNLVVRVGGYSDLFTNLSREQQDDIITRTAHAIG